MELKDYQKNVLAKVKEYMLALDKHHVKYSDIIKSAPELATVYDYPSIAWQEAVGKTYTSHKNGLGEFLPDFYLKVPTAGGKTLLACHSIDYINKLFLKQQTGLVLWVVPSNQIYRQTLKALRDRAHPYRQVLDISSGGRVVIKEKMDSLKKIDVEENLVILLLMLPSAARQNNEVLKVFRDNGGYTDFFPEEDDFRAHEELIKCFKNLDYFEDNKNIFSRTIKTSLGNVLRVLRPIVIVDEGHKAYTENARNTIRGFNPSVVLELSATPPQNANLLVDISGLELNKEEMIKLDINITNKTSVDWKNTLLASVEKRDAIEKIANEYHENTGIYIRPINLIQVERTGQDQRDGKFIHAEDVKDFLIKRCEVLEENIAIKTSVTDDIEGVDLLSDECAIRYIITKQALQEGWDCPFAYILTILTNPNSATAITQLIGRILRQPYARKTKVKLLDESYVYCFKQNANTLVEEIRSGLMKEGLGDLSGFVVQDRENIITVPTKEIEYRKQFKKHAGHIYLPKFVIKEKSAWRDVNYENDILEKINWDDSNLYVIENIILQETIEHDSEYTYSFSDDKEKLISQKNIKTFATESEFDEVFFTKQLLDVVPNPWVAYEVGKKIIDNLLLRYDRKRIAANLLFVIEEVKKNLEAEKNRLAELIFRNLVGDKRIFFFMIKDDVGSVIPSKVSVKYHKKLVRHDNSPIVRSLFEDVPEDGMNELEKPVALYLDEQEKLLWWYRNMAKQDYYVQAWKKNKIYPDFIFSEVNGEGQDDFSKVYILETKGVHLKNEDTTYKQDVFELCNQLGREESWEELSKDFPDNKFEFKVVFEDEWRNRINEIFA